MPSNVTPTRALFMRMSMPLKPSPRLPINSAGVFSNSIAHVGEELWPSFSSTREIEPCQVLVPSGLSS